MKNMIKVYVYFNLRKKVFSIKALEGYMKGKVIKYADKNELILIKEATFKVSEKGRQRVLQEHRKNVHAGIQGYMLVQNKKEKNVDIHKLKEAYYNPYLVKTFVDKETNDSIFTTDYVVLYENKVLYKKIEKKEK